MRLSGSARKGSPRPMGGHTPVGATRCWSLLCLCLGLLGSHCANWQPYPEEYSDDSSSETIDDGINDNADERADELDTINDSDAIGGDETEADACPDDPNKTDEGLCGCGTPDSELRDWYPDCDGDGGFAPESTRACGSAGADEVFDCPDGADPKGGWSDTPGSDCDDTDPSNPCPCGQRDHTGDGTCEPFRSLGDIFDVGSGILVFELPSGSIPLYVDDDDTSGGWVLVGRGRDGWAWNEEGGGNQDILNMGLGTKEAFAPVYLPTSTIQELLDSGQTDLRDVEIRVKRAAKPEGTVYQETLWISLEKSNWTWVFDANSYSIEYHVIDSVLGPGTSAESSTRDVGYPPNDHRRTFTWAWGDHNNVRGFSYGSAVSGGSADDTNFFWQYGNESHAIPYSEVYIRYRELLASCRQILERYPWAKNGDYRIDPDGAGGVSPLVVGCDMAGGGWTVIHRADFEDGASRGWIDGGGNPSPVDTSSSCAAAYSAMLGGYGYFGAGAKTSQTFDFRGIPHTELAVDLELVIIDSWDNEEAIVKLDGVEGYRTTFGGGTGISDDCGSDWNEAGPQAVSLKQAHSASFVTVEITSTLDSGPRDEAFGVDNILLRIR